MINEYTHERIEKCIRMRLTLSVTFILFRSIHVYPCQTFLSVCQVFFRLCMNIKACITVCFSRSSVHSNYDLQTVSLPLPLVQYPESQSLISAVITMSYQREATPHQLNPDAWDQIGGKWVHVGLGVFLELNRSTPVLKDI